MAISDEITRLQSAKADLKTAIEGKGVTVPLSAKLDSYSTYVDSIEQGGGGGASSASENDVNFIDYDGTIVNSYSAEEFASLSALPNNPNHTSEGLVSQGWNWTLANAKTYVETYGALNIGQMYITDNGATRITIDTTNWEKQWQITLQFNQSKANGVAVDFGDGSSIERASGTSNVKFYHTYANAGIFTISLLPDVGCTITFDGDSTTGCYIIGGNLSDARFMRSSVVSVSIGERLTINNYAFSSCHSLQSITIPSGVTSIGGNVFNSCYSLQSITIPSGVTSIGSSVFNSCYSLQSVTTPSGVTSIGNYAFTYCHSLQSITIPSGVTSIGSSVFSSCHSLQSITIPSGVTSIGSSAFSGCRSLQSVTTPSGVTSIGDSAFSSCYSLQSVTIPSGVTSIGNNAFSSCYSLQSVTIPSGVTSIGSSAFNKCDSLIEIIIESTTPPTLGGSSNSLGSSSGKAVIYVPDESVDTYKSKYTTYASRIKGISER